ncbi:MAG: pyrroline-5-carboxylate reductase dimerization domain-containing protein [Eubacteriales bacterium]|nr:pyrroline-5-carboxylate reductase dimerization domain-containing protein [Eubacteriales bacterium]
MSKRFGIIGFGHLGKAFAQALVGLSISKEDIAICARSAQTLSLAEKEFRFTATDKIQNAFDFCDNLIIALKRDTFIELPPTKVEGKNVISLMAGVRISELIEKLYGADEILRAMPTLSISHRDGIIGYTHTKNAEWINLFSGMGFAFEVAESEIEKITAYSACGLGFSAYLIQSMISAGIELGFDEETSKKIAESNFRTAMSYSDYNKTISEVATKGGVTEAGIQYMNENHVNEHILHAVEQAYRKAKGDRGRDEK